MTTTTGSVAARLPRRWPGVFCALLLLVAAVMIFRETWVAAHRGVVRSGDDAREQRLLAESQRAVAAFLERDAPLLLAAAEKKNAAAVQRALDSLRDCFRGYAGGIDAFTRDLTGWGMRSKIVYRKTVETIEQKDEHSWTASLVREKFSEHIVSDARLEADVMGVVKQFAYEIEANRNELLVSLETSLEAARRGAGAGGAVWPVADGFRGRMEARLREVLDRLPGDTVTIGVGSLASGIVAEEAVRQLIRAVIAQAAARVAAGAAASGGAAAGAAATGGAGGTLVAPGLGTVIGVAGGLIAGAAVDWWMTEEFRDVVAAQCRRFLTTTHVALVTGERGLEKLLLDRLHESEAACREAVAQTLAATAPTAVPRPAM